MPAELIGFTLVYVLFPTRSAALAYLLRHSFCRPKPSRADAQDFYFWRMLEDNTAIQLNLAPSRQKYQYNIR